jgi:hypothetical protein
MTDRLESTIGCCTGSASSSGRRRRLDKRSTDLEAMPCFVDVAP